jgi:hypothetical protein
MKMDLWSCLWSSVFGKTEVEELLLLTFSHYLLEGRALWFILRETRGDFCKED